MKLAIFKCPVISWLERMTAIINPITIPKSAAHTAITRVLRRPLNIYE